jgi:hypothetical protein
MGVMEHFVLLVPGPAARMHFHEAYYSWTKLKILFCHFPNPWALRVSGMGGYTSKCEKSKNHCTLVHTLVGNSNITIFYFIL